MSRTIVCAALGTTLLEPKMGSRLLGPPICVVSLLIGILKAWIEQPTTMSALISVLWTISDAWQSLSQYLLEIVKIRPNEVALSYPPKIHSSHHHIVSLLYALFHHSEK